jgi:hypothetical protein
MIPKERLESMSTRSVYLGSIPQIFGKRKKYIKIPECMMMSYSIGMKDLEEGSQMNKNKENKPRRRHSKKNLRDLPPFPYQHTRDLYKKNKKNHWLIKI